MLICHNQPYVVYSKDARVANLKGSSKVKSNINQESEKIVEDDNWQNSYWNRESNENYQKLCKDFDEGKFRYEKHPKYFTLLTEKSLRLRLQNKIDMAIWKNFKSCVKVFLLDGEIFFCFLVRENKLTINFLYFIKLC